MSGEIQFALEVEPGQVSWYEMKWSGPWPRVGEEIGLRCEHRQAGAIFLVNRVLHAFVNTAGYESIRLAPTMRVYAKRITEWKPNEIEVEGRVTEPATV